MNYQSILKRQTSIILISVIFMVLIIIGVSYSLFMQVDESKDIQVLESGTLVLSSTKGTTITTSTVPQSDYDGMNTQGYTFSIKNTGTLDCYYTLYISNVASNPLDYQYLRISIDGNDPILLTDLEVDPEDSSRFIFETGYLSPANQYNDVITHNIKVWIDEFAPASIIGKKIQLQVDLYGEMVESNMTEPELYAGLIPITYDEDTNVVIADTNEEWYNYDNFEWANAILIDQLNSDIKSKYIDTDGRYKAGTIVDMADILQMYVWIPRYRYRIPNMLCSELDSPRRDTYSECYKFNPSEEAKNNLADWLYNRGWMYVGLDSFASLDEAKTAVDNAIATGSFSEYCTLEDALEYYQMFGGEAFTDNDYDFVPSASVTGPRMIDIVFEDSSLPKSNGDAVSGYLTHPAFTFGDNELNGIWVGKFESSGATDNITIVPNVESLRSLNVSDMFNASRAIETNAKYGLSAYEVDTHMMKNMEWGAVAYLTSSKYGIYIDASSCINSECEVWINNNSGYTTGCAGDSVSAAESTLCNAWNTATGVNASTTGNIYGIYDMSGGAWEYVMGNMTDSSGAFYPASSGLTQPESKYYDSYTYGTSRNDYSRGHLGDATKEIIANSGSYLAWNNDYAYFAYSSTPWFGRGGEYNYGSGAGVFCFSYYDGGAYSDGSFRVVLSSE